MNHLADIVAEEFRIPKQVLLSRQRKPDQALARQVLAYL